MEKMMLTFLATAVALGLSTAQTRGDDKQDRDRLNARIHEVNNTVKKRDLTKTALKHISVETGVPLTEVESMHKNHADIGAGGVLMACALADETKKPPEDFMRAREKGKDWVSIARDNHVSYDKLSARLDRLESTFSNSASPSTAQLDKKRRR